MLFDSYDVNDEVLIIDGVIDNEMYTNARYIKVKNYIYIGVIYIYVWWWIVL